LSYFQRRLVSLSLRTQALHKHCTRVTREGERAASITQYCSSDDHGGGGELAHFALLLLIWEHRPEPESLVASAGHHVLATRGHAQVEHSLRVPRQCLDLLHRGELPQNYLVE